MGPGGMGGSEDPSQRAPQIPISQEMNTHERREAQTAIPTSVKKPAIPAWQEPCSSPYFFLYSREGRGQRSRPQPCQYVPGVCGAARALATSLRAATGRA